MKRILGLLLTVCLVISSLNVVMAEGSAVIELGSTSAASGEAITIPINVSNCETGVSTVQFYITYDTGYLTYTGYALGFYTGTAVINSTVDEEGTGTLTIASMDIKNSTGEGALFTLNFTVNQTDEKNVTTAVELNDKEFAYIDSTYNVVEIERTVTNATVLINEEEAEENPYVFVVDRDVTAGYESGAEIYSDENIAYKAEQTLLLNEGTSESVIGEYTYVNSLKSNGEGTTAVVDGTSKTWRIHSSITAVQGTTVTIATKAPSGKLYAFATGSVADGFTSMAYYDGTTVTGEVEVTLDIPAGETVYIMGQGTNPEIYAINAVYNASVTTAATTTESTTESTTTTTTETTTETTTTTTTTTETTTTTTATTDTSTETTTEAPTTTTEAATEASTETTTVTATTAAADDDETKTETEEETEEDTEETTVKKSSSGGGGSSYYVSGTVTTTEAETEEETEDTGKAEAVTEATTEAGLDIKVSIGSNIVSVGGEEYEMDAAPYIQTESSSTLVPLRFVAIAILGGDVDDADTSDIISWDSASKTAVITVGSNAISFTAYSNTVSINGVKTQMANGVKAEIKDGRLYIPFRALGEALGVSVDWDAAAKTAVYTVK
ncbi:MAG: hypothetical protein LUG24_03330 [Clostridiales bacterium]|nr:hypothetical protein [Clostridiales bacterium]